MKGFKRLITILGRNFALDDMELVGLDRIGAKISSNLGTVTRKELLRRQMDTCPIWQRADIHGEEVADIYIYIVECSGGPTHCTGSRALLWSREDAL